MSRFIEMFGDSSNPKWKKEKLSQLVTEDCPISYGIVQPGEELKEGVPIVRPVDLNSNFYVYPEGLKKTSKEISDSYRRTILKGDELLLCVRGTTGVMGLATPEIAGGNVTRGITPLRFKNGINRIYMLSAFLSDESQKYIKHYTKGTTLKGINMDKVRDMTFAMPPIELQNEYEQIFIQADKSKFGDFKSRFIEMSRYNAQTHPLKELIDQVITGEWGQDDVDGTGVSVLRTTNFSNDGTLDLSSVVTRNIEQRKIETKKLIKGDTLLEKSGGTNDNPVGRVVYFNQEGTFLCNNFSTVLRCKKDINSTFFFYSLYVYYQNNKEKIRSMGNKTTGIQNLKMEKYLETPISVPSFDVQEQFEAIVQQADKSKSVCQIYENKMHSMCA